MTTSDFGATLTAGGLADDARQAALIKRVIARDEAALIELYDDTAHCVHALALRLTQDATVAKEVVEADATQELEHRCTKGVVP